MFCHNCGHKTEKDICPKCGTTIVKADATIIQSWRKETDLEIIIKHPEVVDYIYEYAKASNKNVSSQYIIDKFDLVLGTFTGISSNLIMELVTPINIKLGIKTGKKEHYTSDLSINEVLVKVLCAISANKKLEFKEFQQAQDGLLIICEVKPDLLSYKGDFLITLKEENQEVITELNMVIKGQLFDYGKSKRVISKVLKDIKSIELN